MSLVMFIIMSSSHHGEVCLLVSVTVGAFEGIIAAAVGRDVAVVARSERCHELALARSRELVVHHPLHQHSGGALVCTRI